MELYKAVFRHRLITKGRRVIGIEPEPYQVEYLPAGREGEKALGQFIERLYADFEEWFKNGCALPDS